ncbi:MAG: hypothetical protein KKD01_03075 [Proteobacteria bacterium]|nr:hypothetical protein [Pseudomonadota bacterium]MBU1416989.1 hypothetical protein [Pseudomonadota bacterium]MBU1453685.1 hypothetical protein [Pseudomonadota bacterium]
MNNTTHTLVKADSHSKERSTVGAEISKIGVSAIAISAGIIACWATACLFAGSLSNGGPFGLIINLVNAIVG